MPRVSVIIPMFNAEAFLAAAVNSVVAQSYCDWELLLVNDGSTDTSSAIARQLTAAEPERFRYLEHEGGVNRGTSASRNLGVTRARGEFVAFLDADDVWLPQKLAQQVGILDADLAIDMVFGSPLYRHGMSDGSEVTDHVPSHCIELDRAHGPGTLSTRLHPLGAGAGPCPSDTLMRRSAVTAIGGFEEEFRGELQFFEDQAFFAKAFLRLTCYASSAVWIHYRVHPGSISSRVRAAGRDVAVRIYFLNWLENHLFGLPDVDSIRHAAMGAQVAARRLLPDAVVNLRCDGGAEARLWYGSDADEGMCIDVIAPSERMLFHDIQLNIMAMGVVQGARYRIVLELRASLACTLPIGVARWGGDWAGLGLYEHLSIAEGQWTRQDLEFVAVASAERSRIHFDAGQLPLRIDIRRVRIGFAEGARPSMFCVQALTTRGPGSWDE